MSDLLNNYDFVLIRKKKITDIVEIKHTKKEYIAILNLIFLANGIDNVKFDCADNTVRNKIKLYINRKNYKENKPGFKRISRTIDSIIGLFDTDNNMVKVRVSELPLTTTAPPLNTIEFSKDFMKEYDIEENQNINIFDAKSGKIKICTAKENTKLKEDLVALNPSNRAIFKEDKFVYIQKRSKITFNKADIQNVKNILDGYVTVSEKHKEWITKQGARKFEIVNEITGASMDIDIEKLKYSDQDENTIKLNYFQRLVLECELPQKLSPFRYEIYKSIRKDDESDLNALAKYFENGKALTGDVIREEIDRYNHKNAIRELLKKCGYPRLAIYPLERAGSKKPNIKEKIADKVLGVFIGSNKATLKCIRPYETDESSNVVRLTKGTLALLGIDETDNLTISYRNKRIKTRVLIIDNIEAIKENNIFQSESELNACIGIPAYLRQQLGINKINVCCTAERDKRYLFRKNLNIQFWSIIATILAVKQYFSDPRYLLLLIVLIPVSVYVILSAVRNRIRNT